MTTNKMPKGGRKGGTQFPRISLREAVEYSTKLVAKTHTGPQGKDVIWKGVFNNAGSDGSIRASALKQFGLMEGEKDAFTATDLARSIHSAPDNEKYAFLQRACLMPNLFKKLFDTFQSDKVTRAKIRQQALQLKVHPDSVTESVDLFVQSLEKAGLATIEGDEIAIGKTPTVAPKPAIDVQLNSAEAVEHDGGELVTVPERQDETENVAKSDLGDPKPAAIGPLGTIPGLNITLSLDSTMDPEKLERQLKLLRQYGVLK